jgi:transposase
MSNLRCVGLDVHARSIVIAVAEGHTPAETLKKIPFEEARLLTELRRLGPLGSLKVCYEAGPTGFGLQRFLAASGVDCVVVAPTLIPSQSGCRVKTDRRDARKLAHFLRSGDLSPVWIPDEHTEALRDLHRARDDARNAERRARQQLNHFLLRQGRRFTEGKSLWTQQHWAWIRRQTFVHEAHRRVLADAIDAVQAAGERLRRLTQDLADCLEGWALAPLVRNLQAFRGVQLVTAVGLAAEIGHFHRFSGGGRFMSFTGLVPSEDSTGEARRQGPITRTGNRQVRRLLVEAAWSYYSAPAGISPALARRREQVPANVIHVADRAQRRLRRIAWRLKERAKHPNKIVTALARELAGFVWAAAVLTPPPQAVTSAAGAVRRCIDKSNPGRSRRQRAAAGPARE